MTKKVLDLKNLTPAQLSDMLLRTGYKMPTAEMATKRAARLCSALSTSEGERLPLCYGDSHCGRLGCPRCRWFGGRVGMIKALPMVAEHMESGSGQAVTIIPEFGKTAVGELPKGELRGFKNQIRAAIRKVVPDAVAVMSLDVSVERRVDEQEYWQWHVHGVIFDLKGDALDQLRQRFFRRVKSDTSGNCYRPVQVKKLHDRFGWLAYMSKPDLYMREQRSNANGELRFSRKRITVAQELRFVKALSKSKVKERFFCVGMDPL